MSSRINIEMRVGGGLQAHLPYRYALVRIYVCMCMYVYITKCIRFVSGKTSWMSTLPLPVLILGGKNLDFVQSWKHLGHIMCFDMKESLSIEFEMKRFFSSFNSFYHQFKGATPIVLCRLLQAFSCLLWVSVVVLW